MAIMVRRAETVADMLATPQGIDDLCTRDMPPLVAVDLAGGAVDAETGRILRRVPLVTVALVPDGSEDGRKSLADFDVVLRGDHRDATLQRLGAKVDRNPIASVALVQLLRTSEYLDVADGLVAESLTYSMLQAGPEFGRWKQARGPAEPKDVNPQPLIVERDGARLELTFCRPEIRNAFGYEVRDALVEALQLAAADSTITSVVLRGQGPSFCSGGDLREFGTAADPATAHLDRIRRSAGGWLHRVRNKLRAEIHGSCVGSGIELPAFAGHVVAARDLKVSLPEISMGLVPGAGGTVSLPRRIGRQRTAHLALSGESIDADTALAWGLVDELA